MQQMLLKGIGRRDTLGCRFLTGWCAVVLCVLTLGGCYASTAWVEADVPVGIEAYPRAYYDGHVVYWVNDRWYVYDGGVWFYYRSEPDYLYRYRVYRHYPYYPHYYYRPYRYYRPYPYYRPYRYYRPYPARPYRGPAAPAPRVHAPPRHH